LGLWQQVEVLGSGFHGVDGELRFVVEEHDDDLEEATVGVEAEAELACWFGRRRS